LESQNASSRVAPARSYSRASSECYKSALERTTVNSAGISCFTRYAPRESQCAPASARALRAESLSSRHAREWCSEHGGWMCGVLLRSARLAYWIPRSAPTAYLYAPRCSAESISLPPAKALRLPPRTSARTTPSYEDQPRSSVLRSGLREPRHVLAGRRPRRECHQRRLLL
jgi:hypothetical protein